MKAFTQEQILYLYDLCDKRGIDKAFINELPEKAERKTAVKNYNLIYPYQSPEFIDKWEKLRNTPKWKRKTQDCLQECLDWLGNYPEQVAIQSMSDSLKGEWQGLFEPKNYKPSNTNTTYNGKTNYHSNKADIGALNELARNVLSDTNRFRIIGSDQLK